MMMAVIQLKVGTTKCYQSNCSYFIVNISVNVRPVKTPLVRLSLPHSDYQFALHKTEGLCDLFDEATL